MPAPPLPRQPAPVQTDYPHRPACGRHTRWSAIRRAVETGRGAPGDRQFSRVPRWPAPADAAPPWPPAARQRRRDRRCQDHRVRGQLPDARPYQDHVSQDPPAGEWPLETAPHTTPPRHAGVFASHRGPVRSPAASLPTHRRTPAPPRPRRAPPAPCRAEGAPASQPNAGRRVVPPRGQRAYGQPSRGSAGRT